MTTGAPLTSTQQAAADGFWTASVVAGDWIVLDTQTPDNTVWTASPSWSGGDFGFDANSR